MTDIRFATPDDLPDLYQLVQALSAFHDQTAQVSQDALHEIFFGPVPSAVALVAQLDGKIIGYAGLTSTMVIHDGVPRIDVHHLYIAQGHRAKGVGTALIAAAKDYAIAKNAQRLTIGTDPGNPTAIAAYRAMPALEEITGFGPRFAIDLTS